MYFVNVDTEHPNCGNAKDSSTARYCIMNQRRWGTKAFINSDRHCDTGQEAAATPTLFPLTAPGFVGSTGSGGSSSICRTKKLFSSVNWSSSVRSSRNLGRNLSNRSRLLIRIRCTATDLFGLATNTCSHVRSVPREVGTRHKL